MKLKQRPELVELLQDELDYFLEIYRDIEIQQRRPSDNQEADFSSENILKLAQQSNQENRSSKLDKFIIHGDILNNMARKLSDHLGKNFKISGRFFYKENGGMSWHTNKESPGLRIYFSYAFEPGSSSFQYLDPETKKICIDKDQEGWQARSFLISPIPGKLFWHCVQTTTARRISLGFSSGNTMPIPPALPVDERKILP